MIVSTICCSRTSLYVWGSVRAALYAGMTTTTLLSRYIRALGQFNSQKAARAMPEQLASSEGRAPRNPRSAAFTVQPRAELSLCRLNAAHTYTVWTIFLRRKCAHAPIADCQICDLPGSPVAQHPRPPRLLQFIFAFRKSSTFFPNSIRLA